ncbi:MAG: glycine hydroxymethyltransferase [Defluviitaleaceae bacterium]|nr:glycine hydroxymethyltransferase [Defluviitaleaceae bacterium]
MEILRDYLEMIQADGQLDKSCNLNTEMLTFVANIDRISKIYPEIAGIIIKELIDQRKNLKLIASENFSSLSAQSAMANLLTDKYAEGYSGSRFYAGCDNVDDIETLAANEAKALFGAEHAYVQPHSGADANLVAFWAILRKHVQTPALERLGAKNLLDISKEEWDEIRAEMGNQRLLGMDLYSGGHLTHGYRHNVSAQMFDVYNYAVDEESGILDYDNIRRLLQEIKPLIMLLGFSAYSRNIDYELIKKYADEVGAVLMVDMAHFSGLVAGKALTGKYNPVAYADIVTTTTHKTLRGPRGGMILCTSEYAEYVDKGCPHVMGGPLPHVMAAKAVAFREANTDEFKAYAKKVIENSQILAKVLMEEGIVVQTGGTDNHIVLVNVDVLGLTGRQAESALRECRLTLNRNTLPFDKNGPWFTSGLRFGTPAITTLGMGENEITEIAKIIAKVLKNVKPSKMKNGELSRARYVFADKSIKSEAIDKIEGILGGFVLYPEIDVDFFKKYFDDLD